MSGPKGSTVEMHGVASGDGSHTEPASAAQAAAGEAYPYGRHLGALLRKSWRYQRRRKGTVCSHVITPLIFMLLMFAAQEIVNSLIDTNEIENQNETPPRRPAAFWVPQAPGTEQGASARFVYARPDSLSSEFSTFSQGLEPSANISTFADGGTVLFPFLSWKDRTGKGYRGGNPVSRGYKRFEEFQLTRGALFKDCMSTTELRVNVSLSSSNPRLPLLDETSQIVNISGTFYKVNGAFSYGQAAYNPCPTSGSGYCELECQAFNTSVYSSRDAADDEILRVWDGAAASGATGVAGGLVATELDTSAHRYAGSVMYNQSLAAGQDIPALLNMFASGVLKMELGTAYNSMLGFIATLPTRGLPITGFDVASLLLPFFFIIALQFLFPLMITQLVYEKEDNLREMMKTMGMRQSVYWAGTYMFFSILSIVTSIAIFIVGYVMSLGFFRNNAGGIVLGFFFLWGQCQISFAFLVSNLFARVKTARVASFLWVFAGVIVASSLLRSLMLNDERSSTVMVLSLIPSLNLARGLYTLADEAVFDKGMKASEYGDTVMPTVLTVLAVEWIVFALAALYIEAVFPGAAGVPRHPLFFLGKRFDDVGASARYSSLSEVEGNKVDTERIPDDVARESERANSNSPEIVMFTRALRKVYQSHDNRSSDQQHGEDGQDAAVSDSRHDSAGDFVALDSLDLTLNRSECLGVLGPNGAGKTTAIKMLCGFFAPTSGTAFIDRFSIRNDMDSIHRIIGVCPQHDILWGVLTAREHLEFYGRLKGVPANQLSAAVDDALVSVGLKEWGNAQAMQFSGGMKRRLSIAISLMGAPLVVFLDEPTTGLDPASRRDVWQIIKNHRRKMAFVLTTHSMEEAEVLCDRVGIIVRGKLRAIGTSKDLRTRFGSFFRMVIQAPRGNADDIGRMVHLLAPSAVETDRIAGVVKYEIPCDEVSAADMLDHLNDHRDKLNIDDWGISNTTLEDAFVRIVSE